MALLPLYRYIPRPRRRLRRKMTLLLFLLLILATLLFPLYIIYKPPGWLISLFESHWPDVLYRLPPSPLPKKIIALTLDDAPSSYTLDILALLAEHDYHATFFVIGSQVEGRETILQEIIKGGHELANHAWRDEPSRSLPPSELRRQILEVDVLISTAYATLPPTTIYPPRPTLRWFRPGSGLYSTKMRELCKQLGYRIALGNVYPHDPQIGYAGVNAKHVLSMVQEKSVIIMHDRRSWTVPALKIILPELKERGYEVMSLSGAMGMTG